jgi:hypothetical protein
MLPITNESIRPIIIITSCLASSYLTLLLSSKLISLEVISILTARRKSSPPNYSNMVSTPDELIAGFLHSTLLKVTGEHRFEDLKITHQLLNASTIIVSSYEGGGRHGRLGLVMTAAEYFAVGTDVFLPPENPGPAATTVEVMTGVQIAEMVRLHTDATCIYRTYHNVDQAFKKMIINAFEDQHLNTLYDEIVDYENCTSLLLLTHLLKYYAIIAPTELTQNYERINTSYDPNQPIKNLFQQIQDARAFSVAGVQRYGYVMIVNVAFTFLFNTGLCTDTCRVCQT